MNLLHLIHLNQKVTALAKAYSIENGHTPTLYPQEIFGLLNHALKLVKESKNILHLLINIWKCILILL